MSADGMVHLYVGDGKGKTTAAVGLCLRTAGWGKKVLFASFLKGRDCGEHRSLEKLGVTVFRFEENKKFMFQMTEEELEQYRKSQNRGFDRIAELILSGEYDLAVLDESVDAVNTGVLSLGKLLGLIDGRPSCMELVLTGRNPAQPLMDRADYFTNFQSVRHPYEKGLQARRGIEY